MLTEDLDRTVQWQCFDRVTSSGCRCGTKKRVVNRFLCCFDYGEKEWRHRIIGKCFLIARRVLFTSTERLDAHVRRSGEGNGVIAAAVAARGSGSGKAHHRARRHAAEISVIHRCVGSDDDDNRAIGSVRRRGQLVLK